METRVSNISVPEIWQVDAGGGIYEGSFDDLTQWIAEGALLPHDKVRRGNLRWIEASKVPSLSGYFTTRGNGPHPLQNVDAAAKKPDFTKLDGINCVLHSAVEAEYYCETCINYFCQDCPKTLGGLDIFCPLCGAICSPLHPEKAKHLVLETNINNEQEGVFIQPQFEQILPQPNEEYYPSPSTQTSLEPPKKSLKGFALAILAALIVAFGGAYLWAFRSATIDETAEKKLTEVVILEEKYTTDKQSLRLQFAAQSINSAGETLEQAQARLKAKYDADLAETINNYRYNQSLKRFFMFGGISFAIMFFGLILLRASSSMINDESPTNGK